MSQSSSDRWKQLFATSSSTAVPLMEIMRPLEYLSSTQPVSMLNSQKSNVFIMLSPNIGSVNKKNSRPIPNKNQAGVCIQKLQAKKFTSLLLLSQGFWFWLSDYASTSVPAAGASETCGRPRSKRCCAAFKYARASLSCCVFS